MGDLADADKLIVELRVVTEAMEVEIPTYALSFVAGWRGHRDEVDALSRHVAETASTHGEGASLAFDEYAQIVLANGVGDRGGALEAGTRLLDFRTEGFVIHPAGLIEVVEAAERSGEPGLATEATERLRETTSSTGTNWARGVQARADALIARDGSAEALHLESIELLARTRIRPQLARARLLYGEWLRERRRTGEARDQLRTAYAGLVAMGVDAFAERARQGLSASGETVRRRVPEARIELTPQEAHIAQLTVDGCTNAEIAAQLFISPRTVEWHLRKVFTKLGVDSRRQLPHVLHRVDRLTARDVLG
jgi:DNA-binding CsgD family transcriptional regulator